MENQVNSIRYKFILIAFLFSIVKIHTQDLKDWQKKITLYDTTFSTDSSYWIKGSIFNIGFNRVGLYNWAGGGQNSMSVQGLTNNYLLLKHRKNFMDEPTQIILWNYSKWIWR